ncbi:MAG TPA: hypothetical protein VGP72_16600 [Planctomycetota bacterium]|jgi:hypothetical protein
MSVELDELRAIHAKGGICDQRHDKINDKINELNLRLTKIGVWFSVLAVIFSIVGPILAQGIYENNFKTAPKPQQTKAPADSVPSYVVAPTATANK